MTHNDIDEIVTSVTNDCQRESDAPFVEENVVTRLAFFAAQSKNIALDPLSLNDIVNKVMSNVNGTLFREGGIMLSAKQLKSILAKVPDNAPVVIEQSSHNGTPIKIDWECVKCSKAEWEAMPENMKKSMEFDEARNVCISKIDCEAAFWAFYRNGAVVIYTSY